MSAAAFDIGLRIRAAQTGTPTHRLTQPMFTHLAEGNVVFVASEGFGKYTIGTNSGARTGIMDATTAVKRLRLDYGNKGIGYRLVLDSTRTWDALLGEARRQGKEHRDGTTSNLDVFAWWASEAALPTNWLCFITTLARTHFATTDPSQEHHLTWWARQFNDPATGIAAMSNLYARIAALGSSSRKIAELANDSLNNLNYLREKTTNPMTGGAIADMVLFDRSQTLWDCMESVMREDPRWRDRSVWEGRIVRGTVTNIDYTNLTFTVDTDAPCRYRVGSELSSDDVWKMVNNKNNGPTRQVCTLRVAAIAATPTGLSITVSYSKGVTIPDVGDHTELAPRPVDVKGQLVMIGRNRWRLVRSTWLTDTTMSAPNPKRQVPLYVMAAAAASPDFGADTEAA